MGERLIEFSLKNRFLVLLATALIAGGGILAMRRLPIDAVPDVTNVQVQVLTNAPALGPLLIFFENSNIDGRDKRK
jgi:cobalt-zinc-cadmium resistance protein CzcA